MAYPRTLWSARLVIWSRPSQTLESGLGVYTEAAKFKKSDSLSRIASLFGVGFAFSGKRNKHTMSATKVIGFPGMCRMFYPEQSVACIRVKLLRQGAMFQEYFPFKNYDGEEGALAAAKRYWKEVRDSFPKLSRKQSMQVERRKSRTGIIGVTRITQKVKGFEYDFWRASWTDFRGARRTRIFSINKYGEAEARKKAEAARQLGLDALPD